MPAKSNKLTALQSFRDDVEELRARRLDLIERVDAASSSPISKAEIIDRIKATLNTAEKDARSWASFAPLSSVADSGFDAGPAFRNEPLGILALLGMRATLEERLLAEAIAASHGAPLDRVEREAIIAKLEGELSDVERAEELAIREAEAAGAYIVRRPDANPALYLAESV